MSGQRPLLTRGRSLVFLLAAALIVAFLTGWLRQHLVALVGEGLLRSIPWIGLRRVGVGVLIDLPQGLVTVLVGALGGRLLVLKPWRAAPALVAAVWLLDLVAAWLVVHDLRPWTDPLVGGGRLVIAVLAMFGVARALGWHPRKKPRASTAEGTNAAT